MKIDRRGDLSLRLLEIFGTMMMARTTIATAEALGISQPSVSTAIRQLERQLGFELFERQKRRMIPSDEARALFEEVEPLFAQLRSVEARVRDIRGGSVGRLRIMSTPPLGHSIVPTALRDFLAERPGVRVEYDVRRLEAVIEAVAGGSVDLGLVLAMDGRRGVDVTRLRTDRMVALVPPDHALAGPGPIGPGEIEPFGLIGLDAASPLGRALRAAFAEAGTPYAPQVEVRYCHTAALLANARNGIAVVDPYTAQFLPNMDLARIPFEPAIPVDACVLTRPGREQSALAAGFRASFEAVLAGGMRPAEA